MLTYTDALGIDGGHRQTLQLAARHHDLGKLDPRFQARLNGGWPADPAHPLAKPANDLHARAARRAAQAAGWPHGKRHEHTSATLLEAVDDWPDEVDHELLVHLALTHHGDGRPFCSYAPDPTPETIHAMIDNGQRTRAVHVSSDLEPAADKHLSRFVRLQDRYGPWGLAMLEMLVRLADRTVSAEGS